MTTKTKKGRFTPWCWEAERDEYDGESRRGWHLKNRTLRSMTYEYEPKKQYRYAIDYRVGQNETVYLELFEDDGWELVGTVVDGFNAYAPGQGMFLSRQDGCWYIFRKEYDPGRPDTEYEIATDGESIRAFKKTLTKKYRRLLLGEFIFFLYYLILNTAMRGWSFVSYITLTAVVLAMIYSGYRLLCLNVFRPRKPIRLFIDFRYAALIASGVYVLVLIVCAMVFASAREPEPVVPVTASNTPVQLFLDLRPDITVDEVMALAEEYNLEASANYRKGYDGDGEIILDSYTITLVPDSEEPLPSFYRYEGVGMAMNYDPDTMVLESAYLSIDTDDGRAWCHYFPGEPTMEDCETGYNLFLRKSALAPRKYYHADTPEEIVAIAYQVLYPDGLE